MAASSWTEDHAGEDEPLPLVEQVALAVRAGRRAAGHSQRSLAVALGWSPSMVKRVELDAGSMSLRDVARAVEHAGFALAVTAGGVAVSAAEWEETDLVARDRAGRRFPAHREVHATSLGPRWWWEQEYMRWSRPLGPQPRWTTEGAAGRAFLRFVEQGGLQGYRTPDR